MLIIRKLIRLTMLLDLRPPLYTATFRHPHTGQPAAYCCIDMVHGSECNHFHCTYACKIFSGERKRIFNTNFVSSNTSSYKFIRVWQGHACLRPIRVNSCVFARRKVFSPPSMQPTRYNCESQNALQCTALEYCYIIELHGGQCQC